MQGQELMIIMSCPKLAAFQPDTQADSSCLGWIQIKYTLYIISKTTLPTVLDAECGLKATSFAKNLIFECTLSAHLKLNKAISTVFCIF